MGNGSVAQRMRGHAAEWNMAAEAARHVGKHDAAIAAEARKETWEEAAQLVGEECRADRG